MAPVYNGAKVKHGQTESRAAGGPRILHSLHFPVNILQIKQQQFRMYLSCQKRRSEMMNEKSMSIYECGL